MAGIDRFKSIRDEFDQVAGDHVLETVSAKISSFAWKDDVVARTGGEEFAIVVRKAGDTAARLFAEAVRWA